MMRRDSITAAGIGVWTAATLGGGVYLFFKIGAALSEGANFTNNIIVVLLLLLITVGALSGGLWGYGLARLQPYNVRSLSTTAAWIWPVALMTASLLASLLTFQNETRGASLDIHSSYTIAFVAATGLATAATSWIMTGKFGIQARRASGACSAGVAAALGFLALDLFLWLALGWKVGQPVPGRYSMVTITYLCSFAAAFTGGMALGFTVLRRPQSHRVSGATV